MYYLHNVFHVLYQNFICKNTMKSDVISSFQIHKSIDFKSRTTAFFKVKSTLHYRIDKMISIFLCIIYRYDRYILIKIHCSIMNKWAFFKNRHVWELPIQPTVHMVKTETALNAAYLLIYAFQLNYFVTFILHQQSAYKAT